MKKLICAATILFAVAACNNSSKTSDNTPVKWESFSGDKNIERKVDSLLALMTLEEKNRTAHSVCCRLGCYRSRNVR